MFSIARFAVVAYVLSVFVGGYLAVSSLKGLWTEAGRFETLAAAGSYGTDNNTLLLFDTIEPAAGGSN